MPRNMHAGAIHYLFSSYVCIYEEQLYPEKNNQFIYFLGLTFALEQVKNSKNHNFSLKICPSWHIKTFIA